MGRHEWVSDDNKLISDFRILTPLPPFLITSGSVSMNVKVQVKLNKKNVAFCLTNRMWCASSLLPSN